MKKASSSGCFNPRDAIQTSFAAFSGQPLREAATGLLGTLGYRSDRTVNLGNSTPPVFLDFVRTHAANSGFSEAKALCADWKSADLLFQLTDEELSGHASLFKETSVNAGLLQSYLFFAIELAGGDYARSKLTGMARQINRVFPMPVMVLIKHLTEKKPVLSIAVINRRQSKRDAAKDVLGKVTIIRDISLVEPHRGHLDILASFAISNLVHPQRLPINNFDTLHAAWEEIFNVELLNKRFYRELASWYFWALPQVEFPADIEKDDEKRRATGLIRLLTRFIFCWFLKEKGLIPERLFVEAELKNILKDLSADASTYNEAILQNLFFATLNQRMGKDKNGKPFRAFAKDEGFRRNRATYGVDTLYRYEEHFRDPAAALDHFASVPFLNGGLFECLDRTEEGTGRKLYLDGFSRNKKKRPTVPNRLFFGSEHEEDLSEAYGDTKRKRVKVRGLLRILHSYKFTIFENTPIDQEIALDPELLGKVFENLLASYNEETKTTARKQTGSFYTPRPIVEYMVDESLKAHLTGALTQAGISEKDAQAGLDILFAYTEREHPFREREVAALLDAIHTCKILDPACGSGAFPMGMLQKLVYIIHKLDPDNARWKQLQIDAAARIPDPSSRDAAIAVIERDFADNEDDYGRKLYLIENCLYGVDIQPMAIQISKLRFFISLVCDQRTNRSKKENHGIRPLPNLETKFVAADTLIGLEMENQFELFASPKVKALESELQRVRHDHFAATTRQRKLALQKRDKELRDALTKELEQGTFGDRETSRELAAWNPYDPQQSAEFFEPLWMFDQSLADGFDILVGNPPYISVERFAGTPIQAKWQATFATYAARGDVYCFFYERGIDLLRKGGTLIYITSNKWMRAGYGKNLRELFITKVRIDEILDFGGVLVFNSATVDTCTLRLSKNAPQKKFPSSYMRSTFAFDRGQPILQSELKPDGWRLESPAMLRLLEKLRRTGKPLREFVGSRVYRGITTGFNKAFIVDRATRDRLVREQRASAEILKPYLGGRDVNRWRAESQDQWIIFTRRGIDIARYPAIQRYLQQFKKELSPGKPGGRKPGSYEWFEIQDNIAYWQEFEKTKIISTKISIRPTFAIDSDRCYLGNTSYFVSAAIAGNYLLGLLNSKLFFTYAKKVFVEKQGGWFEVQPDGLEAFPIPTAAPGQQKEVERLVEQIVSANKRGAQVNALERELDDLVYALYGLTPEEIRIVEESATAPSESAKPPPDSPPFV